MAEALVHLEHDLDVHAVFVHVGNELLLRIKRVDQVDANMAMGINNRPTFFHLFCIPFISYHVPCIGYAAQDAF